MSTLKAGISLRLANIVFVWHFFTSSELTQSMSEDEVDVTEGLVGAVVCSRSSWRGAQWSRASPVVRRRTFFGEGRSDYSIITVALMNVSCDAPHCLA